MSITDELREYVNQTPVPKSRVLMEARERFNAIADRIDAEHERAMEERADRYAELRASLKERYVELPKDADSVPWNVGDRDEDGNVVTELRIAADGWWVSAGGICRRSYRCRHYHHAPTVEDVLHDFICDVEEDVRDEREIIAEYAAKLRLAEGEDA